MISPSVTPSKSDTQSSPSHCKQRCLQLGLDLLEHLGELLPVIHDGKALGLLGEKLGHLLHLLLALLDAVDANVADARDASAHGSRGTALAVLDGDGLTLLDAELLAGVVVDGGVGLGARGVE
jgi:hypothetical protein